MPSGPFNAHATLKGPWGSTSYYRLDALTKHGISDIDRLPFTIKVLLENVLRRFDGELVTEEDIVSLARWGTSDQTSTTSDRKTSPGSGEFTFLPARVLLQDLTGVPAVVDLAAMRSAVARLGGDPRRINPLAPADLVIDHSVQVDAYGSVLALGINAKLESERNAERYVLLRWAQEAFDNFTVAPPDMGIVHQINLEYLAHVVATRKQNGETVAFPDTLVGTDSHTTMVNGLGVLGWGVGGIEAEAVLLGQPLYLLMPEVLGFRFVGELPAGVTATDLVLRVAEFLRHYGVVNKFVEFYGPGLANLTLADRATISNMTPEYGATSCLFPVDDETLRYLRETGRDEAHVELVERYTKEQGLFRTSQSPEPRFSETVELDLSTIEPSLAGPGRPQDRVNLSELGRSFRAAFPEKFAPLKAVVDAIKGSDAGTTSKGAEEEVERLEWEGGSAPGNKAAEGGVPPSYRRYSAGKLISGWTGANTIEIEMGGLCSVLTNGAVAIAAITSCTNTSNPAVMIAAGLLAKRAVERGIMIKPYVKASLAPGSRAVIDYLRDAGLLPYLEALRFHLVGFGCTTCIGNSGPLPETVASAVQDNNLVVASVLSGNRNFEGRIHPLVRASYLASPPLVVAFALAGTVDTDLSKDPVGYDPNAQPVFLHEIWPTAEEIRDTVARTVRPEIFKDTYAHILEGNEFWRSLPAPSGSLYAWDGASTYVQEPPFFQGFSLAPPQVTDIVGARVLAALGDSVTTDHISPAGAIPTDSPAGRYLIEQGVDPADFNSYGARRGNHQVMVRGTFGNIRLRNALVPGKEGDWTLHLPDGHEMRIYDAAVRYQTEGVPLVVLAGKEYGSGSSRDWAAKGPLLLGVRAVIAETYERIHRSNLVGMGVLPLQFRPGENRKTLGLTGRETYDIAGIADGLRPGQELTVRARHDDGSEIAFQAIVRIDSRIEVDYYGNGGVLHTVLRQMLGTK